jgi:hypothetical protein
MFYHPVNVPQVKKKYWGLIEGKPEEDVTLLS